MSSPQRRTARLQALGISSWQIGCPELIPKLTSKPIWDTKAFPWIARLESSWQEIRHELIGLKGHQAFQQYRAPSWSSSSSSSSSAAAVVGRGTMGEQESSSPSSSSSSAAAAAAAAAAGDKPRSTSSSSTTR